MFLIELFIYITFAWVMYILAKESVNLGNQEQPCIFNIYLWGYIIFFTVISAIRWRVGVDSTEYIDIFIQGEVRDNSKEHIWDALVRFVHDNELPFFIGTGVAAFVQIFFICKGLKGYNQLLIWLPVVLFGGRYYLDLMNGVRQMIVMCGFFYLSRYIVEKKAINYGIGIIALSLIHNSAIILLPFYLFTYIPLKKLEIPDKRTISLAIYAICFIAGRNPSFQGMMKYIESILAITGYSDGYEHYYSVILSGSYTSEALSLGPMMISYLLLGGILIWYGPVLKSYYEDKIPYFNLWYLYSVIYACGYFLVCNLSHMMIRPFQYFEGFQLIMLTMLLNYFHKNQDEYKYHFYALIAIIWVSIFVGVYKNTGQPLDFTTYKVYFFNKF